MIVNIVLSILTVMVLGGIFVFIYEAKHAELVNDDEPFLYGDYDPKKDPTLQKEEEK